MKITDIVWDLEDGDSDYALPKEIEVPKELEDEDYDTIVDWASDEYGWCIVSCSINIRNASEKEHSNAEETERE